MVQSVSFSNHLFFAGARKAQATEQPFRSGSRDLRNDEHGFVWNGQRYIADATPHPGRRQTSADILRARENRLASIPKSASGYQPPAKHPCDAPWMHAKKVDGRRERHQRRITTARTVAEKNLNAFKAELAQMAT